MNKKARVILAILGILLLQVTACTKQDKVITVAGDDAEMTVAIAKARETLPQFWEVFEKRGHSETDFGLKVRVTDRNGVEHFWAVDLERSDGKTTGIINNDPNTVKSVKLGDRIVISEADISDWLYMRDGKMVGNRTLKPLFKQMPAAEVERLKGMMADP